MANVINFIQTNAADELISKVLSGKTLNFTRMAVGDGFSYDLNVAKGFTTLVNEVLSLDITKKETLSPKSVRITSAFKNTDAQKEFYYREVGLYAQDPDTGEEVLYAYGNRNDAAELITPTGAIVVTKQLAFVISVGDSAKVTFNVNADVYALQEDMLDVQADITTLQTNLDELNRTKADKTQISSPYNYKGVCTSTELASKTGMIVNDTWYLTDLKMKKTWNGTEWGQSSLNETDYQEELSLLSENLDLVVTSENKTLIDNAILGDTYSPSTQRYFINKAIPENSIIKSLSFYSRTVTIGSIIYIEFWTLNNGILTLDKSFAHTVSVSAVKSIPIDYITNKETYVSFKTNGTGVDIKTTGGTIGTLSIENVTDNTIVFSNLGIYSNWDVCAKLIYKERKISEYVLQRRKNFITVGEINCDYTELQDAMDAISDDTESNPYTIIVFPKSKPYKRFSMIRKLTDSYPWSVSRVRYMSIIGIDKDRTIVQDDSGEYSTPPCEALCNGNIKNIRFISTHNSPLSTPVQGGYACHIDTKPMNGIGYNMIFDNCDFISYQAPAVGIGLHQNAILLFRNCEFNNLGDISYIPNESYKNIAGYGAVFVHTSTLADIQNQNITFDNCRGITNFGSGLWISTAGNYNGGMTVTAYGNMFYTKDSKNKNVAITGNLITLDNKSFGNNSNTLNSLT